MRVTGRKSEQHYSHFKGTGHYRTLLLSATVGAGKERWRGIWHREVLSLPGFAADRYEQTCTDEQA